MGYQTPIAPWHSLVDHQTNAIRAAHGAVRHPSALSPTETVKSESKQ